MISLLITVVILLIVLYVARLVVAELGLPANVVKIIYVVMALIGLLILLNTFGLYDFQLR
jgi:hypothetical protein